MHGLILSVAASNPSDLWSPNLLLASTPECKVQAFKHPQRLVYGTQFHPEVNNDDHPHGRVIIGNFFRLAGLGPEPAARD